VLDIFLGSFDILLAIVVIVSAFFGTFFVKMSYSVILSLFVEIFSVIFIASIVLSQQINLGEFIVVSIFFIFAIIFFTFNLSYGREDTFLEESYGDKPKIGNVVAIVLFALSFLVYGINFNKIDMSHRLPSKSVSVLETAIIKNNFKSEDTYNEYIETVSLLNQNRLVQKLSHIIVFYICSVVVLFFFSKNDGRDAK